MNLKIKLFIAIFLFIGIFFIPLKKERVAIFIEADNYSAENIENFILKPIKNLIFELNGVEKIKTEAVFGLGTLFVDFKAKDRALFLEKLNRKLELSKSKILNGARPILYDDYFEIYPFLIGVFLNEDNYETLLDLTKKIKDDFLRLKTVSGVKIFGEQKETLYFYFNALKISELKLTLEDLENIVSNTNLYKGGFVDLDKTFDFDFYKNIDDIKFAPINIKNTPLRYSDIFNIKKDVLRPRENLIKISGKMALIVAIQKKKDKNILPFLYEVQKELNNIKAKNNELNFTLIANNFKKPNRITIDFKNGQSLEKTEEKLSSFEKYLQKNKIPYTALFGYFDPRYANFNLSPKRSDAAIFLINSKQRQIKDFINKNLPDVYLNENENEGKIAPFYKIKINEQNAITAGLYVNQISDYINAICKGKIVSYYFRGDVMVPVIIKGSENCKIEDINSSVVYSPSIKRILPLNQIIKIYEGFSKTRIINEYP